MVLHLKHFMLDLFCFPLLFPLAPLIGNDDVVRVVASSSSSVVVKVIPSLIGRTNGAHEISWVLFPVGYKIVGVVNGFGVSILSL